MWIIIKSKLMIEKGIIYIVKIEGANGGQEGSFLEFMFADDVAIITETASVVCKKLLDASWKNK